MKHDHKKTKKLKIALFSMFMFLPFIAIGVTCLTHVFNKEVAEETQTATINYKYTTNNVNTYEDLIDNNAYILTINTDDFASAEFIKVKETKMITNLENLQISLGNTTYANNTTEYTTGIFPVIFSYRNGRYHALVYNNFYYNDMLRNDYIEGANTTITILFVYSNTTTWTNALNTYNFTIAELPTQNNEIESVTITTNPQDATTNIFYDSCTQVQQSFILNWCNTTNPLRNTLNNFTQIVGLPNNHLINDLLTYWLSITIIYIVIDIILELVIYLTHMFNKEV